MPKASHAAVTTGQDGAILSRRNLSSSSTATGLSTTHPPVHILACFRESPRPCVNQDLVNALKPLREERFLIYGSGHHKSIAYATAISVILGTPWKIETAQQARTLPKVGEKIVLKIEEFLTTGKVEDAERAGNSPMTRALKEMSSVHGVGHVMAKNLYTRGIKSLDDMRRSGQWAKEFRWHDDIQEKMPREEVESIARFLKIQLDKVEPGATTMLCGGFRRGKTDSNDVDLLFTYENEDGKERGVLARLVQRLLAKGFIPPDGVLSFHSPGTDRTSTTNRPAHAFDSLDKALIIFRHPANGRTRLRDHWRRVDLVVARWPQWGSAVVGWSGSTQFERDLRTQAHTKDLKFDSGGIRSKITGETILAPTEEDVFKVLGVPYLRQ